MFQILDNGVPTLKLLITLLSRAILLFNYIIVGNPRIFLAAYEHGYPFIAANSALRTGVSLRFFLPLN